MAGPYRVSLVVFDVDGTLIDFAAALRAALVETAAEVSKLAGAPIEPDAVQAAFRALVLDPEWQGRDPWQARRESLRRLLEAHGIAAPGAVDGIAAHYREVRDRSLHVYPDVTEALAELRGRGFALRAATNGNMDLGPLGLAAYFEAVETAYALGVSKPDPRFYASVVERAGVAPDLVLAVGDRVDNDYEPARAAGLHALLIDRRGALDGALPRVRSLTELPSLLERA